MIEKQYSKIFRLVCVIGGEFAMTSYPTASPEKTLKRAAVTQIVSLNLEPKPSGLNQAIARLGGVRLQLNLLGGRCYIIRHIIFPTDLFSYIL